MAQSIGGIEWQVDADTSGAVNSVKQLDAQVDMAQTSMKKLDTTTTKTSRSVNTAMAGMGRKAGQAGIQFQQFIGQIQGGQSAMLALSQQAADLGFVLGAPLVGAVAGISASLIGMLAPALLDSGKETEKLTEKIKELVKASTLTEAQSAFLVAQTDEEINKTKELIKETEEDIKEKEAHIKKYEELAKAKVDIRTLTQDEQKAYGQYLVTQEEVKKALIEQKAALDTQKGTVKDLTKERETYIIAQEKSLQTQEEDTKSVVKFKTELESLGERLTQQVAVLGMSARGIAHYQASLAGATEEMHEQIDVIYDHQQALKDDAEFAKTTADLRIKAIREENDARKNMESAAVEIASTKGDPIAELQAQKDKELAVLQAAEESGLKLHTDYATLRSKIDEEYDAARMAAMEEKFAAESYYNELALTAIDAMGAATAEVISGLLSGTLSLKEAMMGFANTILNEVIGSLVSMGVQYAKNALIEASADQSAAATKQALMAANATQHTASVTAAVAELTSLGAAAAMASTAAIPIVGPGLAPAAGAAMGASIAATGASAIASAPVAGMREHGGSVLGGQTYSVGEKNKPELLMIPGSNGKVLSNSEMKGLSGGGGSTINQTINNSASRDGYEVRSRGDGVTAPQVIDIIKTEMGNASSYSRRALSGTSNVSNVTRGRR